MNNQPNSDRIFFGSLEIQERNRILEESKNDTTSVISHASTRVTNIYISNL